MGKNKLARFAEMETFPNTYQFPENIKGNWRKDIFRNDHPIVLELACGRGEYTVGMARLFPEKNFIGVDIKGSRIWRGAKTCVEENLHNGAFLRIYIENIENYFEKDEVDEIWITFPDPHPPLGKAKKRLTSARFLKVYSHFLKPGGTINLKTDDQPLYAFTVETANELGMEILDQSDNVYATHAGDPLLQIKTTYELRWLSEGKLIHYVKLKMDPAVFKK